MKNILAKKEFTVSMATEKIVNVSADESILTDGKIAVDKLKPITFDPVNNAYVKWGEVVGNTFQDGKKIK